MPSKTLLFSTIPDSNNTTPPTGYTGIADGAKIQSGKFALNSNAFAMAVWYDNTALTGTDIRSSVVLDTPQTAVAGVTCGAALINTSGDGWMVISGGSPANFRVFLMSSGLLSGGALATDSTVPVDGATLEFRRNTSTGTMTVWQNGTQLTDCNYTSSTYTVDRAAAVSRRQAANLISLTSYYLLPQEILSINSGSSCQVAQSGISVITGGSTGFTATPTASASGGVVATITSGSSNNWVMSIGDRVEAATFPSLPYVATLTLTNGAESANSTFTLTKKSTETLISFVTPVTDNDKFLGYWMAAASHTVDAADFWYVPFGDLVVTSDSACLTTSAGTFTGWLRPTAGATAGKTYQFVVTVNETGVVTGVTFKQPVLGIGFGIGI